MANISRRQVLTTLGIFSTAGCLGSVPFGSDDGIRLGSIFVGASGSPENEFVDVTERELGNKNDDEVDEGRHYQIRLLREGRDVYEAAITLSRAEYVMIEPTWSTEPATYTFMYASKDYIHHLDIISDTQNVDSDLCNYIIMSVGYTIYSDREMPQIIVRNSKHQFIENLDGWVC